MRRIAERGYFELCLALGHLLRAGTYATTHIVQREGTRLVRKRRDVHAPLLIALGGPLHRVLGTGVQLLPQRDWEGRERALYTTVHLAPIEIDGDGTLLLPCLPGATLASLLEDPATSESQRRRAIELAADSLAALHRVGFTHGDAMAENVLVDLATDSAHWFDFETVHDESRSLAWRRADDVRALLATCALRTVPEKLAESIDAIMRVHGDDELTRHVTASFTSVLRRPLSFHLGQASLPYRTFRAIAHRLAARATV